MWGEKERFHQSHRPHHYPNSGVVENGSFCISWPIQSCNQVTQGSTHSRSLSPLLSRQLPGVGGRSLNSAPPAPQEYADKCVTSVPERLELYGEAHPKPPTLRRRAPKNIKNPSLCWGESFLDGIRVAQEHNPGPPILRAPEIGKKCRFDTFFGRFLAFRNWQNAANYSIFAV